MEALWVFDWLFGCRHGKCGFPITARAGTRRSEAAAVTGTYIVCLDCGREFPYDWQRMKIVSAESYEAPLGKELWEE